MKVKRFIFLIALLFVVLGLGDGPATPPQGGPAPRRVSIFVWDGLRADDVTPENMPKYFGLARSGIVSADRHAVYPTFTMMDSAFINRDVSGDTRVLRQRGVRAECQREELQGRSDRLFCPGVHRGLRGGKKRSGIGIRAS